MIPIRGLRAPPPPKPVTPEPPRHKPVNSCLGIARITWTTDLDEKLRKLWDDGLSAKAIAVAIGGGITRNSVLGRVHRLKLPGRRQA